jgi:hypothetical protein
MGIQPAMRRNPWPQGFSGQSGTRENRVISDLEAIKAIDRLAFAWSRNADVIAKKERADRLQARRLCV